MLDRILQLSTTAATYTCGTVKETRRTDSAMQTHLNYHRHKLRDLEDRLFHTVYSIYIPYTTYQQLFLRTSLVV